MSRYDSDGLRRVSPHLRAGVGVPRTRPVPVGGLRGFLHPAAAAGLARGRARRGAAEGHHHPGGRGAGGESAHAYIRRADGITYVCPWQTRLRCLLAYGQMRSESGKAGPARLHILASIWTVPLTWFVPFAPAERWLSLGEARGRAAGPATASATRALVYTTPMARARRRVARGLAALRHLPTGSDDAILEPARAVGDLAEVGRWLEDFHPYSLVELDYGGLVHLVSDDALCGDQSVAEIRAAIDGAARGECELTVAMYLRARDRWRAFAEFEQAN